jgi:exodeoxyribonuclease VII small subunit
MSASKSKAADPSAVPELAPEAGFDARLSALEAVAAELESGALPLERAIERYRHGIALLRQCQQELDGYKAQVEELAQEAESAPRAREAGAREAGTREAGPRDGANRESSARESSGGR